MAKERTEIGIRLLEVLEAIRKEKPKWKGKNCYFGEYCLQCEPFVLSKKGEWTINFCNMYGNYYFTTAQLLMICLKESDDSEKRAEIDKLKEKVKKLLQSAAKLEFLDEVNEKITENYGNEFSEILKQVEAVVSEFRFRLLDLD